MRRRARLSVRKTRNTFACSEFTQCLCGLPTQQNDPDLIASEKNVALWQQDKTRKASSFLRACCVFIFCSDAAAPENAVSIFPANASAFRYVRGETGALHLRWRKTTTTPARESLFDISVCGTGWCAAAPCWVCHILIGLDYGGHSLKTGARRKAFVSAMQQIIRGKISLINSLSTNARMARALAIDIHPTLDVGVY